ncbi:22257_t:CDS:10 [Rhizophagus irregularis]|nr:22257_t:CDS:10 [Rhizophagus irregularis]
METWPDVNLSKEMLVSRPEIIERLKKILQPHKDQPYYHVISGEHGTGKTTLIASKEVGLYIDVPSNLNELGQLMQKFKPNDSESKISKWEIAVRFLNHASVVYKAKHNCLVHTNLKILDILQDDVKHNADDRKYTTVEKELMEYLNKCKIDETEAKKLDEELTDKKSNSIIDWAKVEDKMRAAKLLKNYQHYEVGKIVIDALLKSKELRQENVVTFQSRSVEVYVQEYSINEVDFVNCAIHDEDSINSRSEADSKLTIVTSLILSQIDLITCLYILVRTYFQWKKNNKDSLSKHLRFPFYIAIVEIVTSIFQTINLSHASVGDAPLCNPIVKRDIEFNSGRYDYIIFLISTGFSIFYTSLGVNKYGKLQYWCGAQSDQNQKKNKSVLYIILVIIIIHALSLLTFYVDTRMHLRKFKINQLSFNGQNLPTGDNKSYERMIAKKVNSYTLVYIFQLTLLMLYIIISIGTSENTAVSLIRILGITIGGLLLTVQYITNEGWKDNPIPTHPSEKDLSQRSQRSSQITASSIRDSDSQVRLPFTRIQVEIVQQTTTQQDDDWAI